MPVIEQSNKYWNMANLQYEVLYWIYFRWEVRCAFRLDFFDDEIDSIRTFDVDTQRTLGNSTY